MRHVPNGSGGGALSTIIDRIGVHMRGELEEIGGACLAVSEGPLLAETFSTKCSLLVRNWIDR